MNKQTKRIGLVMLLFIVLGPLLLFGYGAVKWKTYIWLPDYFSSVLGSDNYANNDEPFHLIFVVADHYEPGSGEKGIGRNKAWLDAYRAFAQKHRDDYGRPIQHTWFYPIEQYDDQIVADLSKVVGEGFGEIEVHWHHFDDDVNMYESKLRDAIKKFKRRGAIIGHKGKVAFGFIHGNWCLDNSTVGKCCGINNELEILARNGCYADFTFSTIGTNAQPEKVNSIYYAKDESGPKSYNTGVDMKVGGEPAGSLVIFQGPMGYVRGEGILNSVVPLYLEYGAVENDPLPEPFRVSNWIKLSSAVKGKPDWRFVKIYTHAAQSQQGFFSERMDLTLDALEKKKFRGNYRLHYVTAREAFNIAKAAEAGLTGDPQDYYDWLIPRPVNRGAKVR